MYIVVSLFTTGFKMNVWFVSQGAGFEDEDKDSYVRAPSDDGIPTHIRINDIARGDAVILYHDQAVYGIGFYESSRYEPYPDGVQSRIVVLERIKFRTPIPKFRISQQLRNAQEAALTGFPINIKLNVNQGYCFYATEAMLNIVLEHCADEDIKTAIEEKIKYSKEHFESVPIKSFIKARSTSTVEDGHGSGHQKKYISAPPTELKPFKEALFKDERDGYEYRAIEIGGKIWLAQNFRYLDPTGHVDGIDYVNNSSEKMEDYGNLYTWETAQALCPAGWHLPTDEEWEKLFEDTVNTETLINHFGFDCPKAGIRSHIHTLGRRGFCSFKENTVFWSASQNPRAKAEASCWTMSERTERFTKINMNKKSELSVRYVKDAEAEE